MGREVGHTWPRPHEPAQRRKAPQWERRRGGSALDCPCGWARCPAPVVPGTDISRHCVPMSTQSRLPTGQSARVARQPGQLHRAAVCSTVRPLGKHHSGGGAGARPRSAAHGGGRHARPPWYLAPAHRAFGRPDTRPCTRRRVRNDARWHGSAGQASQSSVPSGSSITMWLNWPSNASARRSPPRPPARPGWREPTARGWVRRTLAGHPDVDVEPVLRDLGAGPRRDRRSTRRPRSHNRARGCSPQRRERGSVASPRSSAWPWQRPSGHRQRSPAAEGPRGAVG